MHKIAGEHFYTFLCKIGYGYLIFSNFFNIRSMYELSVAILHSLINRIFDSASLLLAMQLVVYRDVPETQ